MTSGRSVNQSDFNACDPDLSHGRIGQKFDVPDALLQLIECRDAASRLTTIDCWLNTLRTAIDESDAKGVLEIDDDLRHSGLETPSCRAALAMLPH